MLQLALKFICNPDPSLLCCLRAVSFFQQQMQSHRPAAESAQSGPRVTFRGAAGVKGSWSLPHALSVHQQETRHLLDDSSRCGPLCQQGQDQTVPNSEDMVSLLSCRPLTSVEPRPDGARANLCTRRVMCMAGICWTCARTNHSPFVWLASCTQLLNVLDIASRAYQDLSDHQLDLHQTEASQQACAAAAAYYWLQEQSAAEAVTEPCQRATERQRQKFPVSDTSVCTVTQCDARRRNSSTFRGTGGDCSPTGKCT